MTQAPSPSGAHAEERLQAQNSVPQSPVIWTDPTGRIGARCCPGVDVPGVGWQHSFACSEMQHLMAVVPAADYRVGEVPRTLQNFLHSEPLFNLVSAAKALAETQTYDLGDRASELYCRDCRLEQSASGPSVHRKGCKVARVLCLVELFESILQPNPTVDHGKEAASAPEPACTGNGVSPCGLLSGPLFGEPWSYRLFPDVASTAIYDCEGLQITRIEKCDAEAQDWAERIVASVNFCAAFTNEDLESAAAAAKVGAR